ncbi:MAG: RNA polymerase factor sigma-54 [Ignavibacteriaceae bacterium]|nr:RNA polymerase factor sigma-54 [Ignavibacteriaceae bacterium]
MISLEQQMQQRQVLAPQQIQYQKMLQLNNLALEQRIKTELEMNPMLEEDLEQELEQEEKDTETGDDELESDDYDEEFSPEDFMNDEYIDDSYYSSKSKDSEDPASYYSVAEDSLYSHLLNQLYLLELSDDLITLGEEIIGNLDDDGYLKVKLETILDDLNLFRHIKIELSQAEELLKTIQSFDPTGIAARDLKECLIVQLKNSTFDPYYSFIAETILSEHFDLFANKHFKSIMSTMNLSEESLKSALDIIQRLNPKPGEGTFLNTQFNRITPDFIIEEFEDEFRITINDRNLPSISINKEYTGMIEAYKDAPPEEKEKKATFKFLKEKYDSAKWFLACINLRRETMMKIMKAIFMKQINFFKLGEQHLKPLIYKDVSDVTGLDISTISRIVNGKFVQSPQGIHELKYFFSEGTMNDEGEEVSLRIVKTRIKEIVENEPAKKPYSDDKLAEILANEGIHLARRTIAKYREQLKIPVARLRKHL